VPSGTASPEQTNLPQPANSPTELPFITSSSSISNPSEAGPPSQPLIKLPTRTRPGATHAPECTPWSPEAYSTAVFCFLHVIVGFKWNTHPWVDHALIRWLLDVAYVPGADTDGQVWLWKTVGNAYALVVASVDPAVEKWRADGKGLEGAAAVDEGFEQMLAVRLWFEGRVEGVRAAERPVMAWEEARAALERMAWLEGSDGRKMLEKLWRDALAGERARDGEGGGGPNREVIV
jgi:hypothetical protein